MRLRLAGAVATVSRYAMPRKLAAVRRNLVHGHPITSDVESECQVYAAFQNFVYVFADLLSLNHAAHPLRQRFVHGVHGLEHLQATLTSSRGFVAALAHLDNWDLAGWLLSMYVRTPHVLMAPE